MNFNHFPFLMYEMDAGCLREGLQRKSFGEEILRLRSE